MAITLDGTAGTTTPNVVLPGSASGTITLAAPSAAGTQSYTLPTAAPAANGYALTSTTGGVMSWASVAASPAGSTTQIQYNNSGVFGASSNLTWDNTNARLVIGGVTAYGALTVKQATDVVLYTSVGGNDATSFKIGFVNNIGSSNIPLTFESTYISFERGGNVQSGRFDTNGYLLVGYTTSNGAYRLQVNSQIFATNATIATSDGRYKKNVTPISGGLNLVNKLNPVSFNWKPHQVHDFDTVNTDVGFIAQEVQSALSDSPYLSNIVKSNQTELPDGTKEDFLGIADGKLIPVLVKAIQELTARVAALEAK